MDRFDDMRGRNGSEAEIEQVHLRLPRLGPQHRAGVPLDEAVAIAGHVLRWMNDLGAYVEVREELAELCDRVAEPGACGRAARSILDALHQQPGQRRSQAA